MFNAVDLRGLQKGEYDEFFSHVASFFDLNLFLDI